MDAVVELMQRRPGYFARTLEQCPTTPPNDEPPDFWYRGGATLVVSLDTSALRYCIHKDIKDLARYRANRDYMAGKDSDGSLHATYFGRTGHADYDEVFVFLHRGELEERAP